jgi:hypothetical protein
LHKCHTTGGPFLLQPSIGLLEGNNKLIVVASCGDKQKKYIKDYFFFTQLEIFPAKNV